MKFYTNANHPVDVTRVLTPEEIAGIEHCIHHYPEPRAACIDALKLVQRRFGWVNEAQLSAIAEMLGISLVDLTGVATFYNRIYLKPVGRHVILLCDSIACYLVGAETVADGFKKALGIEFGQTTPDGRFTLLYACCLGNCDKGPTLMIDEDTYSLVNVGSIPEILERYV